MVPGRWDRVVVANLRLDRDAYFVEHARMTRRRNLRLRFRGASVNGDQLELDAVLDMPATARKGERFDCELLIREVGDLLPADHGQLAIDVVYGDDEPHGTGWVRQSADPT